MEEELGPEGLRTQKVLELKLPVYRPLLYTDTLHGDQINRDDMWAVSTDELNALRSRLALAEKVVEAVEELLEVSDLRGDIDDIPGPCDDPKLWTARLITAWDELRAALDALKEA